MTNTETKLDDAWNEHVERSGGPLTLDHYDGFVAGWNAAHATARAQPASVPDGWVMVPTTPNEAMREAFLTHAWDGFPEVWKAVLAAALQPTKDAGHE